MAQILELRAEAERAAECSRVREAGLVSEQQGLRNELSRVQASLAAAAAEARASEQTQRTVWLQFTTEREALSKRADLAHERLGDSLTQLRSERDERGRADEALAVVRAEARMHQESADALRTALAHERKTTTALTREMDAMRGAHTQLRRHADSLERDRAAEAEHMAHVAAQLSHAQGTASRMEREREELIDVCGRQEAYWRLCCVRPRPRDAEDARVAEREAFGEWTRLSRVLDRLGVEVPPMGLPLPRPALRAPPVASQATDGAEPAVRAAAAAYWNC